MSDDRRLTVDRFFGDLDDRVENLKAMLEFVSEERPTEEELLSWFFEYTTAHGEDAIKHRITFLRSIGLLSVKEGQYRPTDAAGSYLNTEDPRIVFDQLRANVSGFESILAALWKQTLEDTEIREILIETADFDGGTGVAARHREWLQMLGYIDREQGEARLTEAGQALAREVLRELRSDKLDVWYMNPDDEWGACIEHGVTVTGWDAVEDIDLRDEDWQTVDARLEAAGSSNAADTLQRFVEELPKGTILVAKSGRDKLYGLGVVTGDYRHKPGIANKSDNVHTRSVDWIVDVHDAHGDLFELDWSADDLSNARPFDITTGVRQCPMERYEEIRRQVLAKHVDLEDDFDRLEEVSLAMAERYDTENDTSYFWVNQGNQAEIDGEYLQAPLPPNSWQQDLSRVSPGDVIIHHRRESSEVIGHSTAISSEIVIEEEDEKHAHIPIHLQEFGDGGKPVRPLFEYLSDRKFNDDTDYFLFNKNGERIPGYIFNLPIEAAVQIIQREVDDIGRPLGARYKDHLDGLTVPSSEYTIEADGLYFTEGAWDKIQSRVEQALQAGKHILLFGPPGTGKTKLARSICEGTVGPDSYELVTASADWSTFDTVGGYQTTADSTLAFKPGIILDRFHADSDGTPANEWLIIDEINRADIDKAFGSLFSALTGESVTLPFDAPDGNSIELLDASQSTAEIEPYRYYIPEDWQMFATMNTLDKTSLYEMSYAFMRRWAFIPVGIPDLPSEEEDEENDDLSRLVEAYVAAWDDLPTVRAHFGPVGRIWQTVNEAQPLGPAIVEDIYRYVATESDPESADYVSPIVMYIFPQLEGLRRSELEAIIEGLEDIVGDPDGELWTVAQDFFESKPQPPDQR